MIGFPQAVWIDTMHQKWCKRQMQEPGNRVKGCREEEKGGQKTEGFRSVGP